MVVDQHCTIAHDDGEHGVVGQTLGGGPSTSSTVTVSSGCIRLRRRPCAGRDRTIVSPSSTTTRLRLLPIRGRKRAKLASLSQIPLEKDLHWMRNFDSHYPRLSLHSVIRQTAPPPVRTNEYRPLCVVHSH